MSAHRTVISALTIIMTAMEFDSPVDRARSGHDDWL